MLATRLMGGTAGALPEYLGYVGSDDTVGGPLSLTSLGLLEGDLVIFSYTVDSSEEPSAGPSGFTGMHSDYPEGFLSSIGYAIGYKVMGATPDTEISVTTELGENARLQAVAFRNVETPGTTPDSTYTGTYFDNSIFVDSMSVATDNSVVLYVAALDDDAATPTTATDYTQAGLEQVTKSGSTEMAYRLEVPSGTLASSSGSWSSADTNFTLAWIIPPA